MSELEATRDYARRMAQSDHRPGCERRERVTGVSGRLVDVLSCPRTDGHERHAYTMAWSIWPAFTWLCPGICGGCMPDAERALWTQIADEIEAHLAVGADDALDGL